LSVYFTGLADESRRGGHGTDGLCRVVEPHEDGRLPAPRVPERSVADMLEQHERRPLSQERFERTFGSCPPTRGALS
jgi:hypothetical protein